MDLLWRGFKEYAVDLAVKVRRRVSCGTDAPLPVSELAEVYGLKLVPMEGLDCDPRVLQYFIYERPSKLSGLVVPGDESFAVLINPSDSADRQVSTISHESSHVILSHDPGLAFTVGNECVSRRSQEQEQEASWLSGELLLPRHVARQAVFDDIDIVELAASFGVSVDMARWRTNICGASQMRRNRAKGSRR